MQRSETILPHGIERQDIAGAGVQTIIRSVLEYFEVTIEDARSQGHSLGVLVPRHFIHYFLTITNITIAGIGYITERDHTTVTHSRKVIENWIDTDKHMRAKAYAIAQHIISNNQKQTGDGEEN